MNQKNIIILAVAAIFALSLLLFFWKKTVNNLYSLNNDTSGLIIRNNAVYVAEQLPGDKIRALVVRLEKPGFLVIHEDINGLPGKIIGSSGLLKVGETQNLPIIPLTRTTKDGETLYAMIHFDDGDSVFEATEDNPVLDQVSNEPVMMVVPISVDATEPGEISL